MKSFDEMMDSLSGSMKERTGRSLEEWVEAVNASGVDPLDQKAVRKWLQEAHGIKQNSQWAIADAAALANGWERPTVEQYIASQYTGPKAALRPIFDKLAAAALALGDDVTLEGRAGYTPIVRKRQFAAVAATSKTNVDLGLRYLSPPASERLKTGGVPGQSTHKVRLASPDDVDAEVLSMLAAAYDQNG